MASLEGICRVGWSSSPHGVLPGAEEGALRLSQLWKHVQTTNNAKQMVNNNYETQYGYSMYFYR